jgi:ATP-dependent RNA helicase DDX55/SPB4
MHHRLLTEREMFEKSIQAFVSYIKSYSEHDLKYIFRLKSLDMVRVMRSFFLVCQPKCPELKRISPKVLESFESVIRVTDLPLIPYRDAVREQQRQEKLKIPSSNVQFQGKRKGADSVEAWSRQKEKKQRRVDRREKKDRKRTATGKPVVKKPVPCTAQDDLDDWSALKREKRLEQKRRAGLMTEQEYQAALASDEDDSE